MIKELQWRYKCVIFWLWWNCMPCISIVVKWPYRMDKNGKNAICNPDEIYKLDLENMIGKQGHLWQWRVHTNNNDIEIKILKGKQRSMHATLLALKWN